MKNRSGFTLVELIAVITILAIILGLVTMNVVEFYNKRKVKDYNNMISIIEDNAKIYMNTDNDIYNEIDDKAQETGSCKLSYDRLVDAGLLDKEMINPMDNSLFYNSNKYIKITLDSKNDYSYEYMEENDTSIVSCIN